MLRTLVVAVAAALVVSGCGTSASPKVEHATTAAKKVSRFAGTEVRRPLPAPDFALRDQHGQLVRLSALRGKYVLVTFLYTHCPDVCPLIASNLNTALRHVGPQRDRVRVVAVSVDPRGDTPAAVRAYARRMGLLPQFHFLIGTRAELLPVWRDYGVLAVARKPDTVDHVAYTVLLDPEGRRRVFYDTQVHAQSVVHDLQLLKRRA
jgi:protein SCO1/2